MNLPFSIRNDLGESEFLALEGYRMTKYAVLSKPVNNLMECAGLDIPESVMKPVQASLVINAGKSVSFKSGDYIIHPQWSGSTVRVNSQEYLIMKELNFVNYAVPYIVAVSECDPAQICHD
jgi:hypothetical protein